MCIQGAASPKPRNSQGLQMTTISALIIPADTDEEYTVITAPLSPQQIAAHLGNDYQPVDANTPGIQFYEATTGNVNPRAATLCQLDDAAAGTHPLNRHPNGSILITGKDSNGSPSLIPTEKLRTYAFYLDFTH